MSESIWDAFGVDVEKVQENPFSVPLDDYQVNVDAEVKQFKEDGKPFFVIHYQILSGIHGGKGGDKIFPLTPLRPGEDPQWETKNARTLSSLKRTLIELGLSADQIRAFRLTPEYAKAISGIKGVAKIGPQKNNPEYNAVFEFHRNESAVSAPSVVQSAPVAPIVPNTVPGQVSGSVGSLEGLAGLFPNSQ